MRKGLFIICLSFLLVLSACGDNGEATELPEPTSTISTTSVESENENAVDSFLSLINSSEDMQAEYEAETPSLNVNYYLPATLDELTASSVTLADELTSLITNMDELSESLYSRMLDDGITGVSLYFQVMGSDEQIIAFYLNGESVYNYLSYELEDIIESESQNDSDTTLLYSDDYIDIEYSHCSKSDSFDYTEEYSIFLIVNNKTSQSIIVTENTLAVDGWNLSDANAYQQIAANSKGYVEVTTTELPTLTPATISGSLELYDETDQAWGNRTYDATFSNIEIG